MEVRSARTSSAHSNPIPSSPQVSPLDTLASQGEEGDEEDFEEGGGEGENLRVNRARTTTQRKHHGKPSDPQPRQTHDGEITSNKKDTQAPAPPSPSTERRQPRRGGCKVQGEQKKGRKKTGTAGQKQASMSVGRICLALVITDGSRGPAQRRALRRDVSPAAQPANRTRCRPRTGPGGRGRVR